MTELDLSGWDTSHVSGTEKMFDGCTSLAKVTVGTGYETSKGFPAATASGGRWWSERDARWYTVNEIQSSRGGIADTYLNWGAEPDIALIPIYRMYNTKTSEHLWTKSKKEYDSICKSNGWKAEDIRFYVVKK